MRYAGVLWDMDGTVVDTEPHWMRAEQRMMDDFGLFWSDELGLELVGNALPDSARIFRDRGVPLGEREIIDRLSADVIEQVRTDMPYRPGAQQLLAELRAAGIPCALVTMSYRDLADAVVDSLPAGTFTAVISGDEVAHGKPHPEPYLTGARALGLDPADCVAIEDSITGARSAAAAGVPTLAVPCHVEIPAHPGWVLRESLAGVSPAVLDELTSALRPHLNALQQR